MDRSSLPLPLSGESGGGQLLRSALSLAMITGRGFRMEKIRARRPKPGLMRQHLACVRAAAEISGADVTGAELGATEITFQPGPVVGGDYEFAIGSGGSTTLVLQTLLPALLHADSASTLQIEGGTHNPLAPPFEFIERCYLPVLARMGVKATVALERHGFMQAGGGRLIATVKPLKKWKKLKLTGRGEPLGTRGIVVQAHLPEDIAQREIASAARVLEWPLESFSIVECRTSRGPGNAVLLETTFEHVTEISTGVAQMSKSAESVAAGAAKGLRGYLASAAPVGVHLADQLLLPMALAGGGVFHTRDISDHTRTNLKLITGFLPVRFEVNDVAPGVRSVRISS
ncbi:MAG: RNA 3'-terminal phosphate cyclase [Verrucomicrobia bacterium]|nr:RNA 3'-terminal phosphate cyclase [Verrucomicrobiota bacterium]